MALDAAFQDRNQVMQRMIHGVTVHVHIYMAGSDNQKHHVRGLIGLPTGSEHGRHVPQYALPSKQCQFCAASCDADAGQGLTYGQRAWSWLDHNIHDQTCALLKLSSSAIVCKTDCSGETRLALHILAHHEPESINIISISFHFSSSSIIIINHHHQTIYIEFIIIIKQKIYMFIHYC